MEQMEFTIVDKPKRARDYVSTKVKGKSFTPTFTDAEFLKRFEAYCERNNLNRTRTAEKWLKEKLKEVEDDEIDNMTVEQLREELKALRGRK